jgi:hypothetical protein
MQFWLFSYGNRRYDKLTVFCIHVYFEPWLQYPAMLVSFQEQILNEDNAKI